MVQPGSMVTGGPAKTATQLKQVSENMTLEQKNLYGKYFDQFTIVHGARRVEKKFQQYFG